MNRERLRKLRRIAGAGLGLLAGAYVLLCGVVFASMRRTPDAIGPFMDRVPGFLWAALPMRTLWTHANRGTLEPGHTAPDFDLMSLDGTSRVRLSSLRGRPVVLFFGSYTCPPFRKKMPDMNGLYASYKDRAAFLFIYIEEAHPTDSWPSKTNAREGIDYTRARRLDERMKAGATCRDRLEIPFPMLVDDMDERVGRAYRAWPIRVYVVDKEGRVAFKTEPGPYGFEADVVRPALDRLL